MGNQCGCGPTDEPGTQITTFGNIPAQGVTLNNRHFSARDIYIVCRLQAYRRGVLARRRVQRLRYEMYSPGYVEVDKQDYDNVNVQVSNDEVILSVRRRTD